MDSEDLVNQFGNDNDFKLIKKFVEAGNNAAFNTLIRKYIDKIYWHSRRMVGNHLDADEVVQEVLLVVYSKLKDFQFKSSFPTWLYRIIFTRSLNFIKKRTIKKYTTLDIFSIRGKSTNADITVDIENRETIEEVERALQKIPKKQREVFIMRHFDELSYEEIAEITGKNVGTLKANYHHAFIKVSELMKGKI